MAIINLTQWLTENGERKVNVSYPDGKGSHQTTLRDIGDRFLQESSGWRMRFFKSLMDNGIAETEMGGKYELEKLS